MSLDGERGSGREAQRWKQRAERLAKAEVLNAAGLQADQSGSTDAARAHWKAAADLGLIDAVMNLASDSVHRRDVSGAEKLLRPVAPRRAAAANGLGSLLADQHKAEARRWFATAVQLARGR